MKAIILAAGRGSRMKNLTDEKPKCLIELHGKALLDWQIHALKKAGITNIGIVTGYKSELLSGRGLIEFHNPLWAETNMVSSLACARNWLENSPLIVSYSDIFYSKAAVYSLINNRERLAVTYDPNWLKMWTERFGDPLLDAESFQLSQNKMLVDIGKRPKSVSEVEGQFMGLLRITPRGWAEIQRIRLNLDINEQNKMDMTTTLQMVIDAGRIPIGAIPFDGFWGEIDSQQDLRVFSKMHSSSLEQC